MEKEPCCQNFTTTGVGREKEQTACKPTEDEKAKALRMATDDALFHARMICSTEKNCKPEPEFVKRQRFYEKSDPQKKEFVVEVTIEWHCKKTESA
jgi:hypothetical protein